MIATIVLKILLIIILVIVILLHFSLTIYVKGGTGGEFVIKAKYLFFTLYPRKPKPEKEKKKKRRKEKEEDFEDDLTEETELPADTYEDTEGEVSVQEAAAEEKPEAVATEDTAAEEETAAEDKPDEPAAEEKPPKKKGRKFLKKKDKSDKKEDKKKDKEEGGGKLKGKIDELKRKWEFIKPYIPPAWKYTKKLLKAIRIEDVKINIDTGKEDAAESATFYGKLQAALFNGLNVLAMIFTLKVKEANVNCLFNEKRLDAEGEATVRVRPSTVIAIAFCLLWCCGKIFIPYKFRQWRKRKRKEKEAKKKQAEKAELLTEE
ncbi:hypothetical protein [Ruminococcus sp.]|uniref:hypothetical protein n=1 Tax=Ruminococcus sp. TaxID=41978 RepID=UPI0025DE8DCA|nr:hypothetical protein [Ruminococcus sp.]MBQ8965674.1 hypothetical protein [Ruminococcus sp.]